MKSICSVVPKAYCCARAVVEQTIKQLSSLVWKSIHAKRIRTYRQLIRQCYSCNASYTLFPQGPHALGFYFLKSQRRSASAAGHWTRQSNLSSYTLEPYRRSAP